jgi:hypothetical protein
LFGAEFHLPNWHSKDRKFKFWNIIKAGLKPLLAKYDVIIFDTPSTLWNSAAEKKDESWLQKGSFKKGPSTGENCSCQQSASV